MNPTILALFLSTVATADEVKLTNGTVHEGKVFDLGDSIKIVRGESSAVYPKSMIESIVRKETPEEAYVERAKALKDDDLDGHLALARWCMERRIPAQAQAEYRKVVAASPDHEEARAALGYRRFKDAWMTGDEIAVSKGFVKHKGKWMTPEERDLDLALDEQKVLDRKILQEVRTLLERVRSTDEKKREDAAAALARIEDKHKTRTFVAAVTSSHREIRRFVAAELGRMKAPEAARPLARRAVWDEVEEVRALALHALREINHPDTATFLTPFLDEDSVRARIRCEEALASFKDLRAVGPLLESLENAIETLKVSAQYGEQMTMVVNRVMILKSGQKILMPKAVKITPETMDPEQRRRLEEEKQAILTTLRAITGEDFGDDLGRWRGWLDKKKSAKE